MKRSVAALLMFLFASQAAHAAMCGGGVTCFDAQGLLNTGNQLASSPVIMYTAPATGNGARVNAIYATTSGMTSAAGITCSLWIVHSATNYLVHAGMQPAFPANIPANNMMLTNYQGGPVTGPVWITDENGNPYFTVGAGDSVAISNNAGIPASGVTSGTYYFHIVGQSY